MNYTLNELSTICGKSRQALTKYLKAQGQWDNLPKEGRATIIQEDLAKKVMEHYGVNAETQPVAQLTQPVTQPTQPDAQPDLVEQLRQEIDYLREQIAAKDNQIENLIETNKAHALIIAKYSLLPESTQEEEQREPAAVEPEPEPEQEKKPRSLWQRFVSIFE